MLPKESGQFVAKLSKSVQIRNEKIADLSNKIFNELSHGKISPEGYSEHPCHPAPSDAAFNWIFLVDTINFCFWGTEDQHWEVEWKETTYTGYFALCAAINKALENGVKITDPQVYCVWQLADVENLLKGDNGFCLRLLPERLNCLRQVGQKLIDKYDGNFANCVKKSEKSAQRLLKLVVEDFPCYRDEADYNGERVSLYKRAQILIGDIWSCFEGKGLGEFNDINTLTMFADYRVPQVLVHFGVLEYSKELYTKLEKGEFLPSGCAEEVEIRGCSIEAVERVKENLNRLIKESGKTILCNSILIDYYLWTYRRLHRKELDFIPFHKTECIYY